MTFPTEWKVMKFMFQTYQVIIFNMFTDDFPIKTSIYNGKNNPFMFQSPPTSKGLIIDQPLGISPRTVRFFGDENGKQDLSSGHLTSLQKTTKNPPVFLCFLQ